MALSPKRSCRNLHAITTVKARFVPIRRRASLAWRRWAMDSTTRAKLAGLPTVEVTPELARAVSIHPGLVVLLQHGEPIGAAVNLDELLFILDARRAEDEDTMGGVEEAPSGQHTAAKRKDH